MVRRVYVWSLAVLLLVNTCGFVVSALHDVSRPYELDYGEGIVLYQTLQVTNLANAYKPMDQYPYVVFHYPPVYHLTVWICERVTGDLLRAGRLVSFICGLLIEVTFGLVVFFSLPRRLGSLARWAGALFGGLLPNILMGMRWTTFARVDTLALFLSFAGAAMFILRGNQGPWKYVAFALFVAALFTKQTVVAAPVACLTAAMIVDVRQAARLGLFGGALGASILAGLSWATHGQVMRHIFWYNQNTFSLRRMMIGMTDNYGSMLPIGALAWAYSALVGIDALELLRRRRWRRLRSWCLYNRSRRLVLIWTILLLCAVVVSMTYGKRGANYNYFLEWNLACCPLAGMLLGRGIHRWRNGRWTPAIMVAYLLPMFILVQGLPRSIARMLPPTDSQRTSEAADLKDFADTLKLVQETEGPIFSENMLLLVESGKQVPAEPAIIQELASKAIWDERPFVKMIDEHRFPMIVVTSDLSNTGRFTRAVAGAIDKAYVRTRQIGTFKIYSPRVD